MSGTLKYLVTDTDIPTQGKIASKSTSLTRALWLVNDIWTVSHMTAITKITIKSLKEDPP